MLKPFRVSLRKALLAGCQYTKCEGDVCHGLINIKVMVLQVYSKQMLERSVNNKALELTRRSVGLTWVACGTVHITRTEACP